MRRIFLLLIAPLGLVACSGGASEADPAAADSAADSNRVLIDVRTPAEFAAGHLEGAINIDFQSPTFATEVSALDPTGSYTLYCRSGNRSGQALAVMKDLGFADLSNAGGLEDASQLLGLDIVS